MSVDSLITCPQCKGSGYLKPDVGPCEASIVIGHETIECYGAQPHPGEPHLTLLSVPPCPECGGYDECSKTCRTKTSLGTASDQWFSWEDGDSALSDAEDIGFRWQREYGIKSEAS